MNLYFKNSLTLNLSSRSNRGHFEVNVTIGEAKTIEENVIFSCFMIKIESTTNILVLKDAHKEYQRINYTSSVRKGEVLFLSQQQTYMEFHKNAHFGVHH